MNNQECGYKTSNATGLRNRAFQARYILTLLGFFGFFCVYALRVNLNVAMVAMVQQPRVQDVPNHEDNVDACPDLVKFPHGRNSSVQSVRSTLKGEFDWDSNMQGLVLGSFYFGYVVTQIPGGVAAEKYGAKWLFGIGILITAIFSLLTPLCARWSVWALIIARAIEGLGEGVTYPAMHALIGRWTPKQERCLLSTIIYNGTAIGTVLSLAVSGALCETNFLGGWPSAFYVFGLFGCLWFLLWITLVYDSPDSHPRISDEELLFIQLGQDEIQPHVKAPIPWKSILTSVHMWGLIVTHFGQNWGFYTLLTDMPTYLSNVLHFNIEKNGVISALPNLIQAFVAVIASWTADKLVASGKLKITTIRKIMNSIALYSPALCVLPVAFIGCEPVAIVVLLTMAVSLNGFIYSGFNVIHVDMSPEFAGTLMGITNCIANLPGFMAPSFVGWIVQDGHTLQNWGIVFVTTSAIFVVSGTVFNLFCTAELQPWGSNAPSSNVNNDAVTMDNTTPEPDKSNVQLCKEDVC
ncbi:Putative inorganic phosphate cotransporter [Araneus ventricosus]|uniref:Sialin n=1 Tax=Araneus ventricosus TaxID=182803 RepID=A0A4Y2CIF8_ARAVE|nr:Putative inorganic phosphate cotransporter [Araneus ventricosus]